MADGSNSEFSIVAKLKLLNIRRLKDPIRRKGWLENMKGSVDTKLHNE